MTEIFEKLKDLQDILAEKYAIQREIEEAPKKLFSQDELLARLKKEFIEKNANYEELRKKVVQLKTELAEADAAREKGEKGIRLRLKITPESVKHRDTSWRKRCTGKQ